MNTITINPQGNGQFTVTGDLTFACIDKKITRSFDFLSTADSITVDLSQVTHADSAGLTLLIEWIKEARNRKTVLKLNNIPDQLLTLAKLSGFDISDHFIKPYN